MHAKGASLNSRVHCGFATVDVSNAHRFPLIPRLAVTILIDKTQTVSLPVRPPRPQVCVCTRRGASMTESDRNNLAIKEMT